jgi:hypothetical protein
VYPHDETSTAGRAMAAKPWPMPGGSGIHGPHRGIPAHNEAAGLGATLDSLNAQTVRPQRVVVICARWGILTGQNEMRRGLHPGSHPDIQTYE